MTEGNTSSNRGPAALVDPELVEAARLLRGALVRVHPSFRFEERLAAKLSLAARRLGPSGAGLGEPADADEPTPSAPPGPSGPATPKWLARPAFFGAAAGLSETFGRRVPPGVLIGGAIASAVSLAGAALLARRWRTRAS